MKITIAGKWEIDIVPTTISTELEAELKKTAGLVKRTDEKVEDKENGNDE